MLYASSKLISRMKTYFAYVRVSTVRHGERGSSLQEKKASIEDYVRRHNLQVGVWYEEMEMAAKQGRGKFGKMIKELRAGIDSCFNIHKIDRGAAHEASGNLEFVRLARSVSSIYMSGNVDERRELVETLASGSVADRSIASVNLKSIFDAIHNTNLAP